MSRFAITSALIASVVVAGGCNRREERQPDAHFRPTATIKDIMTSIIDPESDVIWNSVATIVSLTGTEERAPKTDEEWAAVRQSAVQLVEATNLLRIPGRLVAKPGEKSENPRIELQPETIQKMIAEDPAGWSALVDRLHAAAVPALEAIEAKNAKGLFDAGEQMEHACEACHQRYWYPPKEASAWKHEPGGRIDDSAAAAPPAQTGKGGTIRGHVAAKGKVPGNPVIRMGMDPMCAKLNAGKSPVQEIVSVSADGSLANVFVSLQGSFPGTPVPAEPVTIDQRGCVVSDVRYSGLASSETSLVYVPHRQDSWGSMIVTVRAKGRPASLAGTLRDEVKKVDADVAVAGIATLESLAAESIAPQRFGALLLAVFASAAVLLAGVGVYGVMNYVVSQRRHEMGVRLALGATPRSLFARVVLRGLALAGAGAVVGLAGALLLGPLIGSLLSGVEASDALTLTAVPLVIAAIALLACALPARRAAHIAPLDALRSE